MGTGNESLPRVRTRSRCISRTNSPYDWATQLIVHEVYHEDSTWPAMGRTTPQIVRAISEEVIRTRARWGREQQEAARCVAIEVASRRAAQSAMPPSFSFRAHTGAVCIAISLALLGGP